MNDNPVGTPNPLNPAPTEPVAPAEPKPAEVATPVETAAPVEVAPKKKKTGLIVGLIIGLIALIGGAVAAVLVLFVFNKSADAVPAAVTKVLSGEIKNFAINGVLTANGEDSIVSGLSVNLDAKLDVASMTNSVTANVDATIGEMNLDFTFDERQVADGDIYIKVSGLADSVTSMLTSALSQSGIDCDEADCDTLVEQMISGSEVSQLALIDAIEGEWLHADSSDFSRIGSNITNNETQCLVNAIAGASNYDKNVAEIYKQNPFVTYSTENIAIAKKKDAIYKLGLDYAKMAGFVNAMQNSALANDLLACSGATATKKDVTESDIQQIFSNFPTVYAEIDNNNNFTRLYFTIDQIGLTADLAISYPDSVTVEEPSSYLEMSDYLTELMQSLGGLSSYGGFEVEDTEYDYDDGDWGIEIDDWDLDW